MDYIKKLRKGLVEACMDYRSCICMKRRSKGFLIWISMELSSRGNQGLELSLIPSWSSPFRGCLESCRDQYVNVNGKRRPPGVQGMGRNVTNYGTLRPLHFIVASQWVRGRRQSGGSCWLVPDVTSTPPRSRDLGAR